MQHTHRRLPAAGCQTCGPRLLVVLPLLFVCVSATSNPSMGPSKGPSASPSKSPSTMPTKSPQAGAQPSRSPSKMPSRSPSVMPSVMPSVAPYKPGTPSKAPMKAPTRAPSTMPSRGPSASPQKMPTVSPQAAAMNPPPPPPTTTTGAMPPPPPLVNPAPPPPGTSSTTAATTATTSTTAVTTASTAGTTGTTTATTGSSGVTTAVTTGGVVPVTPPPVITRPTSRFPAGSPGGTPPSSLSDDDDAFPTAWAVPVMVVGGVVFLGLLAVLFVFLTKMPMAGAGIAGGAAAMPGEPVSGYQPVNQHFGSARPAQASHTGFPRGHQPNFRTQGPSRGGWGSPQRHWQPPPHQHFSSPGRSLSPQVWGPRSPGL